MRVLSKSEIISDSLLHRAGGNFLAHIFEFRKDNKMRLLYINNEGGGFADYVDVPEGTTVEQFFSNHMPGRKADNYLIRVNRQPVARDYVLKEGDRVTITPTKIEGALA